MTNKNYVVHFCKNPDCNECWIDEDLTKAITRVPKWKYCSICCEKYGYVNPECPPRRKDYEVRMNRLNGYKFKEVE